MAGDVTCQDFLRIALRTAPCFLVLLTLLRADDYEDLFRRAADLSARGKYDQAIDDYKAALLLRPGAVEALNNLAVMYYAAHRYAEAFSAAGGIWKTHPEMASAALVTGMAAVQCNRPQDALKPLESLVAKDPGNRDAILALASAHVALNQLEEASRLYERRTTDAGDDADAWYGLAICYERMAEEASRKLSRIPGGAAYSKRLLGDFLLSMGDTRLAREAFGESLVAPAAENAEAAANIPRRAIWPTSHAMLLSGSLACRRTPGRRICFEAISSASMAGFPRRWSYIGKPPRSSLKIRLPCWAWERCIGSLASSMMLRSACEIPCG